MAETQIKPMLSDEVKERLKNGEDPNQLVIEKWQRVKEYFLRTGDIPRIGRSTCAWCHLWGLKEGFHCYNGCPVKRASGVIGCAHTPISHVIARCVVFNDQYSNEEKEEAIDREIEFVKAAAKGKENGKAWLIEHGYIQPKGGNKR